MSIFDRLRARLGGSATPIAADTTVAPGAANDTVAALIAAVRVAATLELRDGCTETELDAVLKRSDLDACTAPLEAALGAPAKPFGARPAFDAATSQMIDSRGGIDTNQCLFVRRHEDGRVAFAALWPWGNGTSVTLKIGIYDASVTPSLPSV